MNSWQYITGTMVVGHGFGGSFHAYRRQDAEGNEAQGDGNHNQEEYSGENEGLWQPVPFTTGHFEEVTDLQWETFQGQGRYLVSVSKDQTTRLWVQPSHSRGGEFREMSRVQVHGYDLTCLDLLPNREHRLISGADEKTLRVFDATNKVLGLLAELCGIVSVNPAGVETAYVPALALSTKAVGFVQQEQQPEAQQEAEEQQPQGKDKKKSKGTSNFNENGPGDGSEDADAIAKARARVSWQGRGPPLEGELVDHTLWPEIAKLYGHGNGITCLASDHAGHLVASACKARDPETAQVRLWNTTTWRSAGVLPGHQSTVVQLAFSHDDQLLVSVSKDRQICLYAKGIENEEFKPVQALARAHKRIIWSCDWSHDDALLATGSRDGTVKLWLRTGASSTINKVLETEALVTIKPSMGSSGSSGSDSVTAVAFAPRVASGSDGSYILAMGLESGDIELWTGTRDEAASWRCISVFQGSLPHVATVQRLRWKPLGDEERDASAEEGSNTTRSLQLASCGADHAVKIAKVVGL